MKEAKFNFIQISELRERPKPKNELTVSINVKNGRMGFSNKYIETVGLSDRFVFLLVDEEKCALGWRRVQTDSLEKMKGAVKIKKYTGASGSAIHQITITSILKRLKKVSPSAKFKNLEVQTYNTSYIDGRVDYVILKQKEDVHKEK